MRVCKSYQELKGLIPKDSDKVSVEHLMNPQEVTKALLHFITPEKDSDSYMDVNCYKVRTYDEDGDPNLIQYLFKMTTKNDGSFTLSYTDSPIHGSSQADLEILYSLYPYIYHLTPEVLDKKKLVVPSGSEIH